MRKSLILIAALLIATAVADVKLVASEFSDKTFEASAVQGWTVYGNKGGRLISTCGDNTVFGGYDAFGAGAYAVKNYNSGVDHFELTFSFDLYSIDSWDNEVFSIYVDDQLVYSFQSQFNEPSPKPVNCGSASWGDRLHSVSLKFSHYRQNFQVKLISNLNQDAADESWGIKNFQILARHSGGNISIVADEFNESNFKADSSSWTLVDVSNPFTSCGSGNKLFGGYDSMGKGSIASKTYNNLAGHYGVIFSFDLWLIDSPDGNDYVQVIADGQMYRFYRPDWNYGDANNFICGVQGWSERVVKVNLFVPHRGASINFSIRGVFDEARNNESFGFRNFRVITLGCSSARCKQITNEFYQPTFADPQDWTDEGGAALPNPFTTCSNVSLFGGFKIPIQKVYDGLLPHSGVRIFFRVIALGNWSNAATGLQIYVNEVLATAQLAAEFTKNKVCNKDDESIRNYYVDVPHSSSILDLVIKPVNFQGDTLYSIRDLSITSYVEEGQTLVSSEFNQVNFDSAVGWTVTGNVNNKLASKCGKYSVFGGFYTFGKKTSAVKTYSGLPAHDYAVITFNIYFIDTWDRENFNISVDGAIVKRLTKSDAWRGHQNLCGNGSSLEETFTVQIYVPHSASDLKLQFSDELDELTDNESWGLRDLVILTGQNQKDGFVSQNDSNCITVYSACNFEGQSLAVCDDIPDLKAAGWTKPIRSIYIPSGKSIKAYKQTKYQGDYKEFKDSQNCLSGQNFLLINKAFNVDVHPKDKLKHQKRN